MRQKQSARLQWHHLAAILIASFAFFMSGLISERVFERLPHLEDELAYLYQARVFAGGNIVLESPEPPSAYWMPFIVDSHETGNRFSKYTPGWSALLTIGVVMGQAWVVNAFLAALTVALIYRLGREIFNPDIAIIAALLTAFSPAALLLNGTLMSHTSGLFFTTLFIFAYWSLEKGNRAHLWGMVAGLSLGILAATRPLTTLGIGLPFIAWSGVRLLNALVRQKVPIISDEKQNAGNFKLQIDEFSRILTPLLVLAAFTLLIASVIPAYSWVATGDPQQNLYELVWDYDKIGFGEGHGRNRHRIEKAFSHARFDLSLTAADLFGWQFEPFTEEMVQHVQDEADYFPGKGYSFYLLPLGVLIGLFMVNDRKRFFRLGWLFVWAIVAYAWVWFPQNLNTQIFGMGTLAEILTIQPTIVLDATFSWFWVGTALLWLFLPLFLYYNYKDTPEIPYTWLIFSVIGSVVIVQMLYWIGSQRYSTRYYYEALGAASYITAIPIAWLINRGASFFQSSDEEQKSSESASAIWRVFVYIAFLVLCLFTLYNYSTPRIEALYRFNGISPELIAEVEAQRVDDRPIVAVIVGASDGEARVRWRSYAALMVATSPYFDSDIIAARDFGSSQQRLLAAYPDRQFIIVYAVGDEARVQGSQPIIPNP